MEISGWGRYPKIDAQIHIAQTREQISTLVLNTDNILARGLGRSYGDSSLSQNILHTAYLDHFLAFDEGTGLLKCSSGVSLAQIIKCFLPRGWFLPVTPGTAFVTIGGAIASDVHGKNHSIHGSFSEYITELELLLGNGETVLCSPLEKPELFHATCGGMGLTGIILTATIRLKPTVSSNILQTTIKIADIDALFSAFEEYAQASYCVAWIDGLRRGKNLGRGIFMRGEHAEDNIQSVQPPKGHSLPLIIPFNSINTVNIRLFNTLYYTIKKAQYRKKINFESFFYPLDGLSNWNYLYGASGFIQYQFVLPDHSSLQGVRDILEFIQNSGCSPCLIVIKKLGEENLNYLSFPMKGYTLAIDFKASPAVLTLLNQLDTLVLKYGGRLYLTKDARMSAWMFKEGYPRWEAFENVRAKYHALGKFTSSLSLRIGLE